MNEECWKKSISYLSCCRSKHSANISSNSMGYSWLMNFQLIIGFVIAHTPLFIILDRLLAIGKFNNRFDDNWFYCFCCIVCFFCGRFCISLEEFIDELSLSLIDWQLELMFMAFPKDLLISAIRSSLLLSTVWLSSFVWATISRLSSPYCQCWILMFIHSNFFALLEVLSHLLSDMPVD